MINAALEGVALVHTGATFAMLVFVILHIYLLTTGHSFIGHVQPMIDGYDEVELSPTEERYLEADELGRIRCPSGLFMSPLRLRPSITPEPLMLRGLDYGG